MKHYILLAAMLLTSNGCASNATDDNSNKLQPPKEPHSERCLAANPSNVQAWINAMPTIGTNKRHPLHLNFRATTPTPGYQFALEVSHVMESFPEQVVLNLIVTRPSGMVAQVVTENDVRLKLDNFPGSDGSKIQLNCEGKPFLTIDKVMSAH